MEAASTALRDELQDVRLYLKRINERIDDIEDSILSEEDLETIRKSEEEYRNGKTKTLNQVKLELGF